jgi:hypothetical protein
MAKNEGVSVSVTPDSMDFGNATVAMPQMRSVVISNNQDKALKIENVTLSAPEQAGFSYKSECPAELEAGGLCSIVVTWQPTNKGPAQGVLAVKHSGKGGLVQTELKGSYTPSDAAVKESVGRVDISPANLDFGTTAGGLPMTSSFVISNHTTETIKLQKLALSAATLSGLTYKSECPAELQPEEMCSIIMTWQPTSKGLAQGVLTVQHSG